MDPCLHPHDLGIEEELAIADGARALGDWTHALHHTLNALSIEPCGGQALAGLRRLHAEHDVFDALERSTFAGAFLARAVLLADRGDLEQAITLAAHADRAMPQSGVVDLLAGWLDQGPLSNDARAAVLQLLASVTDIGIGRVHLLPGERAAVEPYVALAERIAVGHSDLPTLCVVSGLLRRVGRCDDAIRAVEPGLALGDNPSLFAQIGLALRAAGRPELALAAFERAHALTGDPMYIIERARSLADGGRYAEARTTTQQAFVALGQEPDPENVLFLSWLQACEGGDPTALARDCDWVRRTVAWESAILAMSEASTNFLRDPRAPRGEAMKSTVSSLEAPSARMCLALHQGAGPSPRAAAYGFGQVPSPDPRLPRRNVSTLLWHEVDGVMVQAVPEPAADVRALVAETARSATDLFTCWDAAGRVAHAIAGRVDAVARAMVYPLDPPDNVFTPDWVYSCQVAAACIIARSDANWKGTRRRAVLLDLLRGPGDWTTAAAALVLGEVAVREPDALAEVRRELIALALAIPTGGFCSYAPTLALVATKVPGFPPGLRERLVRDWISPGDDESPVAS